MSPSDPPTDGAVVPLAAASGSRRRRLWSADGHAGLSAGYKRWALLLLVVVYAFNLTDRSLISILGQAIKQDLKLSDLELGLLGGLSFALFYTLVGIPIARLAERRNRVVIIAAAVAAWSLMTALCGLAQNYVQLLLCRVGVGVGEAGCTPPSQSIIADYYPRDSRASAISIYSLGNPIGIMCGALAAGWIAVHLNWRYAFILLGLPGVLLAGVVLLFLKEPVRGASEVVAADVVDAPAEPVPSLLKVVQRMLSKPALLHMIAGLTLGSFIAYGTHQFLHPYLVREYQMGYAQAATVFGLIIGLSAIVGTAAGGFISDWGARYDKRWYAWLPAIGLTLSGPLTILAMNQPTWQWSVAILLLPSVLSNTYVATTFGSLHNMMEPRMRASAMAVTLFVTNLVGGGLGPVTIGFLSDVFARRAFTGDFAAACPGGVSVAATAAGDEACRIASGTGVRMAIISVALIYIWAGVHYLLAARTIRRDLAS